MKKDTHKDVPQFAAGLPIIILSETPAMLSFFPYAEASNRWSVVFSKEASINTLSFILATPNLVIPRTSPYGKISPARCDGWNPVPCTTSRPQATWRVEDQYSFHATALCTESRWWSSVSPLQYLALAQLRWHDSTWFVRRRFLKFCSAAEQPQYGFKRTFCGHHFLQAISLN